ncbi:MAG: hypothetical protein EA402_05350 [Planctomycetota bacterium]|nr:MAG: hypothetical protein EA402_05350 [Planctomycetota bacterium]
MHCPRLSLFSLALLLIVGSAGQALVSEESDPLAQLPKLPPRLELTFHTERHLSIFPEALHSQGSLVIDRPAAAVRWHFNGEVTLILVGDHLRRFDPQGAEERIHLARDPSAQSLKRQMIAFRDGDWAGLLEWFRPRTISETQAKADAEAGHRRLHLEPVDQELSRLITSIVIVSEIATAAPVLVEVQSANGDTTAYRFDPPSLPEELDPVIFQGPPGD